MRFKEINVLWRDASLGECLAGRLVSSFEEQRIGSAGQGEGVGHAACPFRQDDRSRRRDRQLGEAGFVELVLS